MERTSGKYQIHFPAQAWAPRAMSRLELEISHRGGLQNLSGLNTCASVQPSLVKKGWVGVKCSLCFRLCPFTSSHPWAPLRRVWLWFPSTLPGNNNNHQKHLPEDSFSLSPCVRCSLNIPGLDPVTPCVFTGEPRTGLSTPHVRIEKRKITSLVFNSYKTVPGKEGLEPGKEMCLLRKKDCN